jgi:hypothetical protein
MQLFSESERGITMQSKANVQLNKTRAVRVHGSAGAAKTQRFPTPQRTPSRQLTS